MIAGVRNAKFETIQVQVSPEGQSGAMSAIGRLEFGGTAKVISGTERQSV